MFHLKRITFAALLAAPLLAAAPAPPAKPAPVIKPAPVTPAPPPAPPTAPGPALSADLQRGTFIQTMDAEFRRRDANGDGKIVRAELEQFERGVAYAAAQARNRELFQRLDADRNGVISPGEFAALAENPPLPDVQPLMNRFDPNRDQSITLIEYRAATLANFDRLDADHDGVVTGAEMRASTAAAAVRPQGR